MKKLNRDNMLNEILKRTPEEPAGWLETKLPEFVIERLWSYIETAKKNPNNVNKDLAGNISKSFDIVDEDNWFAETVLDSLISKFEEYFPKYTGDISVLTHNVPYNLNAFWVNFQKQYEFNPLHNHSGIYSFVIFMKIPTDWKEQHTLPISANSNTPKASNFEFRTISMLGDSNYHTYFLDKNAEGGMLFFPAKLNHTVYPFYECDKERVSISGNISFNTQKYERND